MEIQLIVPILIFILLFIFSKPIALSMFVATISYFLIAGMDLGMFAEVVMNKMLNQYILITAPLFIFTANVMNTGKVTENVFKFATGLMGRFKGGAAHVNIIASFIFSGMTGSAIADASGLGVMVIEAMREEGFDDEFSCAVTAASATIGPVFPPSIPMVIYALFSGASVGALFLAGMVPGVLIGVALILYVAYISNKRDYPTGVKYTLREFLVVAFKALPALLTPVILLGGIYTGIMTPTEAGAVAALYALIVSFFVYKTMGVKDLYYVLKDTVKKVGVLGAMISAAMGFSFIFSIEQVPNQIANYVMGITQNPYIFLLVINIAFLIMGMFLSVGVIQVVFLPMMIPIVRALGIDMVHFGVISTLNMMIGLSTPPFGMLLFLVSGISDTRLGGIIKETLPMVIVMLLVLLLVTYFPNIVLFLPNLFS